MNELEEIRIELAEAKERIFILETRVRKLQDFIDNNPPKPIPTQFPKWGGGKQI